MRVREIGCLVTGASAGIGRALAVELGRRACRVALVARGAASLDEAAAEVAAAGGSAAAFPADVSDPTATEAAVEAAAGWAGSLSLAVVNAGVGAHGSAAEMSAEDLRRVIDVNLVGALVTTRTVLPHLLAGAPSALVALSSLSGLIPYRGGGAYGASKAGLVAALRCLRLEVAGRRLAVGWVCPGAVDTAFLVDGIPHGKLPRLSRWLVPVVPPKRVVRAVIRNAERGGGQTVMPATAAFFAAFARHFPRLGEKVELLTGAGEV